MKPDLPSPAAHSPVNSTAHSTRVSEQIFSGEDLLDLMRQILGRGLPVRFRAGGWSMFPFIRDGDVVTIAPIGASSLRLGDVVAFVQPENGRLVVHRVVAKREAAFLAQGDNAYRQPDGWLGLQAALGRCVRLERQGRRMRLGLGPERFLIALASRFGLLAAALRVLSALGKVMRGHPAQRRYGGRE